MIIGLHHVMVTIPVGAEEFARHFYCDLLGLQEIEKPPSLQARGGLWLKVGDQEVHLGIEASANPTDGKAHLAYQVDDLTAWRQKISAAGIVARENAPIPGYDRFEIRDPFSNRIEFIQRL